MTYEDKYKFLLSRLQITDVDYWGREALVVMCPIYYQWDEQPSEKSIEQLIEAQILKESNK